MVKNSYAQVGVSDLDGFLEALGRREKLGQVLADVEREFAAAEAAPENPSLAQQVAKLKADQEACNQELLSMSGAICEILTTLNEKSLASKRLHSRPSLQLRWPQPKGKALPWFQLSPRKRGTTRCRR